MSRTGALLKPDDTSITEQLRVHIAHLEDKVRKMRKALAELEGIESSPQPERYDYAGTRLGDAAVTILKKWGRPATYGEIIDELQAGGGLQGKTYPQEQARKAIDRQIKLGTIKHAKGSKPVTGSKPRRVDEDAEFERKWKAQLVELA